MDKTLAEMARIGPLAACPRGRGRGKFAAWPGLLVLLPCSACCNLAGHRSSSRASHSQAFALPAFSGGGGGGGVAGNLHQHRHLGPRGAMSGSTRQQHGRKLCCTGPVMSSSHVGVGSGEGTPLDVARRLSVAPMMDYTDRYDRYFLRLMSHHALLYTEMVTTGAIIHGDRERHLGYNKAEEPVALQLGGSDPKALAECAKIGEEYGYNEINLNCGCPSDRVSSGSFGACLMATPDLVADCVSEMRAKVNVPVTVKHRIGIDDLDSYELLHNFVTKVGDGGCEHFIVHARKAILGGLSPKQNREIPPLNYSIVHALKRDFPDYSFSLNGGVTTIEQVQKHLEDVDAVMVGRAAYHEPWNVLGQADVLVFGQDKPKAACRQEVIENMIPFIEHHLENGVRLNTITKHMLGLFHGCNGGRAFRRYISDNVRKESGIDVFLAAVEKVPIGIRMGTEPDSPIMEKERDSAAAAAAAAE